MEPRNRHPAWRQRFLGIDSVKGLQIRALDLADCERRWAGVATAEPVVEAESIPGLHKCLQIRALDLADCAQRWAGVATAAQRSSTPHSRRRTLFRDSGTQIH
jgi:hypothetical protein